MSSLTINDNSYASAFRNNLPKVITIYRNSMLLGSYVRDIKNYNNHFVFFFNGAFFAILDSAGSYVNNTTCKFPVPELSTSYVWRVYA